MQEPGGVTQVEADIGNANINEPGRVADHRAAEKAGQKQKRVRRTVTPGIGKARGFAARIRRFSPGQR